MYLPPVSASCIRNRAGNSYRAAATLPSAYQTGTLPILFWTRPAAVREEQRTGDVRYKPLIVPRAFTSLNFAVRGPTGSGRFVLPWLRSSIH